jgi:A/G-specific adenine glycosylase
MQTCIPGLFWTRLLNWHINNERLYPWRSTKNPYHVLIAEFLLQQTNAELALTTYTEFLRLFPSILSLVHADPVDVENIIGRIGLTYRAQRLKQCAEAIVTTFDGQVPRSRNNLLTLPGVGPYIADAVLCYAFDEPTVPIDTNVIRLFSRFFGLKSNKSRPRTDKVLAENIAFLYPNPISRRENLAVLDFASLICKAKNPHCDLCPFSCLCAFTAIKTCHNRVGNR